MAMLQWDALEETCRNCQRCALADTRHNVVFGMGNPNAEVMFIGEGPGENEDLQGLPFVGRAGELLDDMKETLAKANGVGLAAPQIGILRRVAVVLDEEEHMLELVNPQIVFQEGEQTGLEGCLSVPNRYGTVTRPEHVRVKAQDRKGAFFEVAGEGITARCFCHELEHLDGHVFTERVVGPLYTSEELDEIMAEEGKG